jgi:dual oxidase
MTWFSGSCKQEILITTPTTITISFHLQALQDLYPNGTSGPDDVDLSTGGLLMAESQGGLSVRGLPQLFREIIVQQFTRIRDADRFWFENPG